MSKLPETVTVQGGIDPHVHLREPSPKNKSEDFESGTLAALRGGDVFIIDKSNTEGLQTTTEALVVDKHQRAWKSAYIPIGFSGGVDVESGDISHIEAMSQLVMEWKFYDDITTGSDSSHGAEAFRPFISEVHRVNPKKIIAVHAAEDNVQDWIDLVAGEFKHPLVICHVNDPEDAKRVYRAKMRDMPVYSEVTVADLVLNEEDVKRLGWLACKKPPLRPLVDTEQLLYQLIHGTIDMVGTDHAPHSLMSKFEAQIDNPEGLDDLGRKRKYGMPSLEFGNPLLIHMAMLGKLSIEKTFADSMINFERITSSVPADVYGIQVSPNTGVTYRLEESEITQEDIVSKCGWTPFLGKKIGGRVLQTVIGGKKVVDNGQVIDRVGRAVWGGHNVI